jgi:photosystem II stability/assembly factor-like uncharacterized protein
MFVATVDGIFLLERGSTGQPWQVARRALEGSHVCSLAVEPSTGLMIAGTHNAGVAISDDGGRTWRASNDGIAFDNVYSVATSMVGGKPRLYAGTEPAHLYVSDDLGASWRELETMRTAPNLDDWTFPPPPHLAHVKHITFDPHHPECIYASVEQGELLRSRDGGETWEDLLSRAGVVKEAEGDAHRVVIRPSRPNELFMPTGFGLFRSEDEGQSWVNDKAKLPWIGYPDSMVFDPNREDVMFVAGGKEIPHFWIGPRNANASVARTRDGGKSWELASAALPADMTASIEAMAIDSTGTRAALYIGNTAGEVYCSEDDGDSWKRIIDGLPAISKGLHHMLLSGAFGGPPREEVV